MKPRRNRKGHTHYRPWLEPVEDRRMLSTISVNTAVDENDQTDSTLSLREAIEVSNGDLAISSLSAQEQAQVTISPFKSSTCGKLHQKCSSRRNLRLCCLCCP